MFMTLEDETDTANIIVWPSLFEKQRRLILSSAWWRCGGAISAKAGYTPHCRASHRLSDLLRSVGDRDDGLSMRHGRGRRGEDRHTRPPARGPRETDVAPAEVPATAGSAVIRVRDEGLQVMFRLHNS
jgi:error-prone DNA polymerase